MNKQEWKTETLETLGLFKSSEVIISLMALVMFLLIVAICA